jgi:hypothetical protein
MADNNNNFADAQLDHPWVEKYRIPVLKSFSPQNDYFAAFVFPYQESEKFLNDFKVPTEEDAILMSSYIDYRIDCSLDPMSLATQQYINIRNSTLDTSPGIDTISIAKSKNLGWVYKKKSSLDDPFPQIDSGKKFNTLMKLLNFIESFNGYKNHIWYAHKMFSGIS